MWRRKKTERKNSVEVSKIVPALREYAGQGIERRRRKKVGWASFVLLEKVVSGFLRELRLALHRKSAIFEEGLLGWGELTSFRG
jgi:hypothetical protein